MREVAFLSSDGMSLDSGSSLQLWFGLNNYEEGGVWKGVGVFLL